MCRPASLAVLAPPTIPASLTVRRAKEMDAEALAGICGRAYINECWEPEDTRRELFHDHTVRAVLVVAEAQRILATASLQVHSNAPDAGQIRWVATEQDWRRRGLAKTLLISLLQIAVEEGCVETYLKTTTDLPGAISMYLQLGFEPVITIDEERDTWRQVFSVLGNATQN